MSKADEYYEERLAGRGLAPAHVVAVKKVIAKAYRKGEKPGNAVKAFLKEKGIELRGDAALPQTKSTGKKADTTPPEPEKKTESKKSAPEPTAVVPLDEAEVKNMDRKSLKAMAAQLNAMGATIKVLKSDDDPALRRKVSDALAALPSPEVIKTLESVDPTKLKQVLSRDCLGIYVDLKSAACLGCNDNEDCVKKYLENLKGNFDIFKDVIQEIQVEEQVEKVTEKVAEAQGKSAEKTKAGAKAGVSITYDSKRVVFVQSMFGNTKNPWPKKNHAHGTSQAVIDELSELEAGDDGKLIGPTMKQVREIIEREYDIDNDAEFIEWFGYLRSDRIVMLDIDLNDEERTTLTDNGITV